MHQFFKYITATFLFAVLITQTGHAQIAVIANKNAPVDSMEKSKLLDYYIGDLKRWGDGSPVILFDLEERTNTKKEFYKYLGKTTSRMKSIWMKNMLSGEGEPPNALSTEIEMLKRVAHTPGSIGFVSATILNDSVKVILMIKPDD